MARTPTMTSDPSRMFRGVVDGKLVFKVCWTMFPASTTIERWNGFFWEVY